ncbi:N6-adenosine-methyltransferase catalytic subunit isoform X1 [Lethenteron reissneri]|uniref:N6-adenosine-methyltransferase catalytic subunit isoform X1 n=1 Tax=Lethenteron reissneri TaxID=7753 RepID=UPI002AB6F79F|nr:N6-adenosine-methyltransferase catalytic subunit isoform X1 [Lethenteron reissneri]XP_061404212.1 N6-adenosine-methyltransferase catalytic subunit isoform X1 [Lethenteron reissneri]
MSDTWSSIQAHKKQLSSLRERLQRRWKDPTQLGLDPEVTGGVVGPAARSESPTGHSPSSSLPEPSLRRGAVGVVEVTAPVLEVRVDPRLESRLLAYLSDLALPLPVDSAAIQTAISQSECLVTRASVESLLHKFAAQELIAVSAGCLPDGGPCVLVTDAEHSKLSAMLGAATTSGSVPGVTADPGGSGGVGKGDLGQDGGSSIPLVPSSSANKRKAEASEGAPPDKMNKKTQLSSTSTSSTSNELDQEIMSLLSQQSTREQESKKVSAEILQLLTASTAKEQSILEKFRSRGGAQVREFCEHGTKQECMGACGSSRPCPKLHFRRIIHKHTDESLGDCSFLNTCFHMDTCKYVHYEIDGGGLAAGGGMGGPGRRGRMEEAAAAVAVNRPRDDTTAGKLFPSQWINCDIRFLDMSILGKFSVVMADPPWDIHMELPYGTLTDDEMRRLNIPVLQDDGYIFLWVTGRAMELGRECLKLWGYERVDELIWVKTNQLQRIIRTGRTGHWLNHGKEHCLVGMKGNTEGFNRGLDCDVLVAEVRSTSHKPDEIYGIIERLSPGTRKIELFGRPHNIQPNWVTLGNQLDGIHLLDPEVVARFKKRYPDGIITKAN